MKLKYLLNLLGLIALVNIFSGCSSSNLIHKSWVDPELQLGDLDFKEVLILALVPNNNHKIIIENEVAKRMINTIGVPAHKVLEKEDLNLIDMHLQKKLDY